MKQFQFGWYNKLLNAIGYMYMIYTCVLKTQFYRNTNISSLFLFKYHNMLIKITLSVPLSKKIRL